MKMPQTNHSSHIVHWYMVEHSGACCEHTDRLKISLSLSFAKKVLIYLYFFVTHKEPYETLQYLEKIFNPIPTSQGWNQSLYEHHVSKSGRNRVNMQVCRK